MAFISEWTTATDFAILSPGAIARFGEHQLVGVQRHVVKAASINSVLATALAAFMAPAFGWAATLAWLGTKLGVSALRVSAASERGIALLQANHHDLRRLTLSLLSVDGAVWGVAGAWWAFGPSEVASLTCAVLCSVALMATHGFYAMSLASNAYVIPMLTPLAIAAATRLDAIGLFVSGGTCLVLLQSIVTSSSSERRMRREFAANEATEAARVREAEHANALQAALQEVKRQGAVKSLFLGTMSHELRTPLHGILGLTQIIRQQTVGDPIVQRHLALVEASGSHLLELIGALLDISRIESGKLELHNAPFDLALELSNLVDLYRVRCETKGLDFNAVVHVGASRQVHGDAARLRQILHNLLGNAVKFTKSGLIVFKVDRRGDTVSFDIRDTGPGISSEALTIIFDAFRQADDSMTRPADGTGLGLTIARELSQAMGGDIKVSSAVGVGSQFIFTAHLPEANLLAEDFSPTKLVLPNLRHGYRVLLVEDNEVNALIATANLHDLGATVCRAHDGEEAIAAAFEQPRPEFVLMDCRMPVMDGKAATREIRAIERKLGLSCVPIVALTASPSEDEKRECYEAGMDGVLTKPFTPEQLVQTIALYASNGFCNREHPLYEYAKSLDDSEPELFTGAAFH